MLDRAANSVDSEGGEWTAERRKNGDSAALLLSGMQFAVFESDGLGGFRNVNAAPGWFERLLTRDPAADPMVLTDHFPYLSGFLPTAEQHWAASSAERLQSDFWTETDGEGVRISPAGRRSHRRLAPLPRHRACRRNLHRTSATAALRARNGYPVPDDRTAQPGGGACHAGQERVPGDDEP